MLASVIGQCSLVIHTRFLLGKMVLFDQDDSLARHFSKRTRFVLPQLLVRVGVLGHVGRFTSVEGARYPRSTRVICRTRRGLEVGEVLSDAHSPATFDSDGAVLRRVGLEDDLLLARLERNKDEA